MTSIGIFGIIKRRNCSNNSNPPHSTPKTTPPSIPMEVITKKIELNTSVKTRLRIIKNAFGVSDEKTVNDAFNKWDSENPGHLRGHFWDKLLDGVVKDTKTSDGDNTNWHETNQNISAAITEYILVVILKGQFAIHSINDKEKKAVLEDYMKKYTSTIDKVYYNDTKYKTKIEALGLTVPTL